MKKLIGSLGLSLLSAMPNFLMAQSSSEATGLPNPDSKTLVVFFSRPGQNYSVGTVTEGNTKIVARMIAQALGSDLMEIVPVQPYPTSYDETVTRFKKERATKARPEVKVDKSIKDYDLIFIGYPIWGGEIPPPVYTWLEANDWKGKTIVPFSTSGGSGLSSTPSDMRKTATGAEVRRGFTVYGSEAQHSPDTVKGDVESFLQKNGYLQK